MKLLMKIVGYTFVGIVALLVLAFIALQVISDDQYKSWITGAAESATGRELAIDGEFDLQIGTAVGLAAHDITFANAEWGSRPEMVSADRLFVQVKLLPLLKGVLDVTVELDGPDILMETDAEGKGNWAMGTGEEKTDPPEPPEQEAPEGDSGSFALPVKPYIRNLEINDLVFNFNDAAGGMSMVAALETLRIFVEGTDLPLTLKGAYQGAPIELAGSLGNIEQWHANETTPISLKGALNESAIAIEGSAGPMLPSPNARLEVALKADDISTFEPFVGAPLPDLRALDAVLTFVVSDGRMSTQNITLNLDDQRLMLTAGGLINSLSDLTGIDVELEIGSDAAADLLQGLELDLPYSLPKTVRLKGRVKGDLQTLSVQDLELVVQDAGLDLKVTGAFDNVLGTGGGGADVSLNLESTSIIGDYLGRELPQFGPFGLNAKLSSADKILQLESLQLVLDDSAVSAKVEGSAERIGRTSDGAFEVAGIALDAEAGTTQLQDFVARLGVEVPVELPASFDLNLSSAGDLNTLEVTDLQAVVKDTGTEVTLNGKVGNVMDLTGITATLKAMVEDTGSLSKYAGQEIPALGSLQLTTNLSSGEDTYKIDNLELLLDGELVKGAIKGAVKDLMALTKVAENTENFGLAGIDADINIEAPSVSELGVLAGVPLPDLGGFNVQSQLASSTTSIAVKNLEIALSGDALKAEAKAAVEDVIALAGVATDPSVIGTSGLDVTLDAEAPSLAALLAQAGITLPEVGSLKLNGHVGSTGQSLKLDTLNASLAHDDFKTNLSVTVEDVLKVAGIKAEIDGDLNSLSSLSEYVHKELPETGPWVVNIKADSAGPKDSPAEFAITLEGEGITGMVDALVADVRNPQTFETELAIDVESMASLLAMFSKKVPEDKPMKITGKASGKPGEYRLEELTVLEEQSKIMANLAYVAPAADSERARIDGEVIINDFDFTDLLAAREETVKSEEEQASETGAEPEAEVAQEAPVESETTDTAMTEPETEEVSTAETKEQPDTGKRIFSDQPLAVGFLHDYDIDVKLQASNVKIPNGIDMDGEIGVNLENGLLRVDPFDLDQTNGGSGQGYIKFDASQDQAVLDAVLNLDDFVSPRFGGLFDLDLDLDGQGQSLAEVMGSLNGHFAAALKEVELQKSFMSQFGAGLLSNLNPLDSDKTTLECAVIRFDIEDGLADFHKKIAAQTSEVTWMGGGEINLKTEELDVGIAPKARGAVSGLTNIGLASLVHVGGTLAEPKIGIDVADVAKKYVGYSAFIATGGLSFLAQKMADTVQANVDQCERILGDLEKVEEEKVEEEKAE